MLKIVDNDLISYLITLAIIFILGAIIGVAFFASKPKTITITVPGETHTVMIHDTSWVPIPVYIPAKKETLWIDSTTHLGDIPYRKDVYADSIQLYADKKRIAVPIELGIGYRGILYDYTLHTFPLQYEITQKGIMPKPIKYFGSLCVSVDNEKQIQSEVESGLLFLNHVAMFGRIESDNDFNIKPRLGVRINF